MADKRELKWFTTLRQHVAIASAGNLRVPILGGIEIANMKGSTVTRIIADFWARTDTLNTFKVWDFGILWYPTAAVDSNAYPDLAVEEENYDWLLRSRMFVPGGNTGQNTVVVEKRFDNRSGRICRSEQDQLMLVSDLNSTFSGGIFLTFIIRVLMRLP